MRGTWARMTLGVAALAVGAWLALSGEAQADPPVASSTSTSVSCGAFNVLFADGGPGATNVSCGSGYRAVYMETEATAAAYICGTDGCEGNNYTTVGLKRCVGCNNGSAFDLDGLQGTVKCVSGTADASVVFAVHCSR